MSEPDEVLRDALRARLLRRMGHAVQHDLKSPVQGIYWSLELALKGVSGPEVNEQTRAQVEKAVNMARKELARLERTSKTFLADAGIADESESGFDLAELARETVRHFVTEAAMRDVRLSVDTPAEPVLVHAPRAEIAQAVLTCIVHALDCVPAGGSAEVAVRRENGRAVVDVRYDTAAQPAGDDEYALGTMGLRIARQWIELRGGELSLGAGPNGQGCLTCVRLPADAA